MDFMNLPVDLQKIADAIIAEIDQLQRDRGAQNRLERITLALLNHQPQSERDAAACRATEIRTVSNGRPQFYIPDLGE